MIYDLNNFMGKWGVNINIRNREYLSVHILGIHSVN